MKPISNRERWSVAILLSLGMVVAYIDRANLSVALASKEFKELFQLSDSERGLLNSAFFWSYALLQVPAGFVVDRWGVKYPYAVSFLFWSGISALSAFTGTFWQLLGVRILLGIGEAVVTPASLRWIRLNVPEKQRGLATGILFAGAKLGPAIGAYLAARLLHVYGWQWMFVILGVGCLVWLIPWMLLVRNDDKNLEAQAAKQSTAAPVPFGAVFQTPAIYGIIIGTFAYNYFNYFCLTWLPAYFVERWQMDLSKMGLFVFASFAGMAVMAIVAGAIADNMIARGADAIRVRKGFTIAGLLVASTELIGPMSGSPDVAVAFAIVSLTGLGLATANYWALTQSLMPGAAIGRIAGVQNFASNLSGAVAPWLTGWLVQTTGSYEAPMQAIFGLLMAGVAAYIFLVRPKYAPRSVPA